MIAIILTVQPSNLEASVKNPQQSAADTISLHFSFNQW